MSGVVYLMYHELRLPGRPLVDEDPGYTCYVVAESDFKQQLSHLRASGFRGLSVGEALGAGSDTPAAGPRVVITFDDGCETDLIAAAPLLREAGMGATFYVIAGSVGRRGFLSKAQLRELCEAGFEVGSHSVTHSFLTHLTAERVRAELADSKDMLEQWTGRRVEHFSCPGGRWNEAVSRLAAEVGYETVATSRVGANTNDADRFRLSRIAVMRGTTPAKFAALCRAEGLWKLRARAGALDVAKRMLGNTAYQKFRSTMLGHNAETAG